MRKSAALIWAMTALFAALFLVWQVGVGVNLRSDLTALIPQESQDNYSGAASDRVTKFMAKKIVLLVGHKNRSRAFDAAKAIKKKLVSDGWLDKPSQRTHPDQLKGFGALYFPHRYGLLNEVDRTLLKEGRAQEIVDRALAQAYGVLGFTNAKLLQNDPYGLASNFLTTLPVPRTKLAYHDGVLSTQAGDMHWVMVSGVLAAQPYALDVQDGFTTTLEEAMRSFPDVVVKRTGALFYAKAGANTALNETSMIGGAAVLTTILILIFAFRSAYPLLLSLLVIAVGFISALSFSLWFWPDLHVIALLFGISLIGVTVDYSLEYCAQIFSDNGLDPFARLKNVFSGISLGAATTIIGYLTMLLAPLPGLRQIALFSVVGSLAAWVSVVLWFPYIDKRKTKPIKTKLYKLVPLFLKLWELKMYKRFRYISATVLAVLICVGIMQFHIDDDVRKLQKLSPSLRAEQQEIQSIAGSNHSNQFIAIHALNEEEALQKEEAVIARLRPLLKSNDLANYQALSSYVPSLKRQAENIALVHEALYKPYMKKMISGLQLPATPPLPQQHERGLMPDFYMGQDSSLSFLSFLNVPTSDDTSLHIIMLEGVNAPLKLAAALDGMEGVRFVDPVNDYSNLFGKYRARALGLLIVAALFMLPLLIWRYGFRKSFVVFLPPVLAVVMTPFICGLFGAMFTFFDAIALLLVLSMGLDYSIFYTETKHSRRHVTLYAIALSACTTMMSFGFLVFSSVTAVHNFGLTMLVGASLAFVLAPLVRVNWSENNTKLAALLLVLLLPACAMQPSANGITFPETPIAPNLLMQRPSFLKLDAPVDVVQNVVATYGNRTFSFQGRISANEKGFKLVCFDPLGQKLLSVDWDDKGVVYSAASWLPPTLKPENILADLILIYWPQNALLQSIAPAGRVVDTNYKRRIYAGRHEAIKIDYIGAGQKDIWGSNVHYVHLDWGYSLNIESKRIPQ